MRFLNSLRVVGGYDDRTVDGGGEGPPALSGPSDRLEPKLAGSGDGAQHVLRTPRGGDRDRGVARSAVSAHQPRKDILKAVVVAEGGEV